MFIPILAFLISTSSYSGSFSFGVNQRFFNDPDLGRVNGFSEWGALEFDTKIGLHEFAYRIEPYIGFSYIQNSTRLLALNDDGTVYLENGVPQLSQDKIKYRIFSGALGVRQKAWEPEFFWLIPHAFAGVVYRYGRVQKVTYREGVQKLNTGGEFGAEIGGGLMLSFFFDDDVKLALQGDSNMKDFSLVSTVRYLPGGWFRHGLGLLSQAGGWDFGLGLFLDF